MIQMMSWCLRTVLPSEATLSGVGDYMQSYAKWWTLPEARHNYYYWWAHALAENVNKGNFFTEATVQGLIQMYKAQFFSYANGTVPAGSNSAFDIINDCLWNVPGNEGQEGSISGEGCRTLIQSLMFGEAQALGDLFALVGDNEGSSEMHLEADRWAKRVFALWNENISSFDTLRAPHPPPPPPPPLPPMPTGWGLLPTHNGTFCCDQSPCANGHSTFLFEGSATRDVCVSKCLTNRRCAFVTFDDMGNWCFNAEFCNTTNPFAGPDPLHTVYTWKRPQVCAAAPTAVCDAWAADSVSAAG
eukprot:m.721151 g.721151  ORF g.721151 m.721151 type:complete len:301 (-) comp23012_c0_seq13:106-1008(-)